MNFKKTILTLTLISFTTLPAFAEKKQTFTCESSVDANGNVIYLPVKPVTHAARTKMKSHHVAKRSTMHHRRVAKAEPAPVYREETKTVDAAPVVVDEHPAPVAQPAPVVHERTAYEKRQAWYEKHRVTMPIYGNMSGWAGRSTISYAHGTDNPFGKLWMDSDEGSSAVRYRHTATDQSTDF